MEVAPSAEDIYKMVSAVSLESMDKIYNPQPQENCPPPDAVRAAEGRAATAHHPTLLYNGNRGAWQSAGSRNGGTALV